MNEKSSKELNVIGTNTFVSIADIHNIPAKIDTGADSSAIWASNIKITKDNNLEFTLFAPESSFYTGNIITRSPEEYRKVSVRSSNGETQDRYCTQIPLVVNGRKIKAIFTLADRSKNKFPVLIGRRTLKSKFLVDVSKSEVEDIK